MNVNKKFDRFKQWGRERMGSEVKTDSPEEFKMLELEMSLRYEGASFANLLIYPGANRYTQAWSASISPQTPM